MIDIISDTLFIISIPIALYFLYKIYIMLKSIRDMIFYKEM